MGMLSSVSVCATTRKRLPADAPMVRKLLLGYRMIHIRKCCRERIAKDRCRFPETNAVLPPVRRVFGRLSFEFHTNSVQSERRLYPPFPEVKKTNGRLEHVVGQNARRSFRNKTRNKLGTEPPQNRVEYGGAVGSRCCLGRQSLPATPNWHCCLRRICRWERCRSRCCTRDESPRW
jgi:hypothetical protein